MARKTGFTTSILHADRDVADRARRAAQAAAPLGRLRLPRCARAGRGLPGQGARATPTGGRAIRPPRRSRKRSTGWRTASPPCASAPAWPRSARSCSRCCAKAITSSPARFCSATPTACSTRWQRTAIDVSFVDATDVRRGRGGVDAEHTRMVFVETIANPRTQVADLARIGELCAARGIVYVVDNTMTSPYLFRPKDGQRQPGRQRADQVHRRPRQRARRQRHRHRQLRLDALSEHLRQLQGSRSRAVGHHADPQKGPARLGRHAGRRAGASPRGRRRDAGAAHGAGNARTRSRWRDFLEARSAGARRLLSGARIRIRSIGLAGDAVLRLRRAAVVRARSRASTVSIFSIACSSVVLSSNLGDNRTLAIPVAHTIFYEMGAGAAREHGHRRLADSHFGRASRTATT